MKIVELLQQIGLNKYEAEAYYTLLTHEPLTGYEVGKHSHVPLSRSYEVLERLAEKGLVLVQPGSPPRYAAQDPQRLLEQVRTDLETTLKALTTAFATLSRSKKTGEFWVVRGQQNILAQARSMIAAASSSVDLIMPAESSASITTILVQAREHGCRIFQASSAGLQGFPSESLLLLCDSQEMLAGTIAPSETCQAMVSSNRVLVVLLRSYFLAQQTTVQVSAAPPAVPHPYHDWIDWEEQKQRRLRNLSAQGRVA